MAKFITTYAKVRAAYKRNQSKLDKREKDILRKYYGFDPKGVHTQRELGEIYGVTGERIRQLRMIALNKIGLWP